MQIRKALTAKTTKSEERTLTSKEREEIKSLVWLLTFDEDQFVILCSRALREARNHLIGESFVKYRKVYLFHLVYQVALDFLIPSISEVVDDLGQLAYKNLQEFLATLSLENRMIFILKVKFDLTEEEISDVVGTPLGTTRFRVQNQLKQVDQLNYSQEIHSIQYPEKLKKIDFDVISEKSLQPEKEANPQKESLPVWIRFLIEGVIMVALIVFILMIVPRVKHTYERWTAGRLDFYGTLSEPVSKLELSTNKIDENTLDEFLPESEASKADISEQLKEEIEKQSLDSLPEYQDRSAYEEKDDIFARYNTGRGKIYRIYFKSDNPEELKNSILELIKEMDGKQAGTVELGTQTLGGIYFNFYLEDAKYEELLERLKGHYEFNTYLNYSIQRIPRGHTNVVVWIQQI